MFFSERFVDHRHQRRIFRVRIADGAALQDGDLHRLEVFRFNDQITGAGMIARRQRRRSANHEGQAGAVGSEWQRIDGPGRLHPGNRRQFFHDRIVGTDLLVGFGITDARQIDLQRHQAHRIEARIRRA